MKKFITALLTALCLWQPVVAQDNRVYQIVIDQITRIESEFYDPKLLLQIYQAL